MGLIEDEIDEVRRLCHNKVEGSRLITCVPALVRIQIRRTDAKQLTVSFQFPPEYPHVPVLLELKSNSLSSRLLAGLSSVCEKEAAALVGRPQILPVACFLRHFIDENPLCCCSDEVTSVKQVLALDSHDQLKLRQKHSSVSVTIQRAAYRVAATILIPEDYPQQRAATTLTECLLPAALQRWLSGQADEIARTCVEPPLRSPRADFRPKPSLLSVVRFLADEVTNFSSAVCPQCKQSALPDYPALCQQDGSHPLHVERVYCGHLYHFGCLVTYMKTPPFSDGKLCHTCGKRIFHDKYKISPQLAEARWSQEQARKRELDEVIDFMS